MKTALLVASTGGHLAQLTRLAPRFDISDDSMWVTFRGPQSESLLAGHNVTYLPYIQPRDWKGTLRATRTIHGILRANKFDIAISTGAALAVAALPLAKLRGVETVYIESVSRVDGPSLSGKILAALRAADLYTQHESWSTKRWRPHESVFTTFTTSPRPETPKPSLFVTLGTIQGFRFDALIDAIIGTGFADERTVWQVGYTTGRSDLPGRVYEQVSAEDFAHFAVNADVVVTHAGVGSLLGLLELGVFPTLAVRRSHRNEHIDDHQEQIARLASSQRVAIAAEVEDLTADLILESSRYKVISETN